MQVIEHTTLASRLAFGRVFIRAIHRQLANAEVARLCREFLSG